MSRTCYSTVEKVHFYWKWFFYILFLNLTISDYCCFDPWTEWQHSSLTCGRVCEHRTRNLRTGVWAYTGADECNYDYSTCPWTAWKERSCVSNNCRKFDFKINSSFHLCCNKIYFPNMQVNFCKKIELFHPTISCFVQ